MLTLQDALDPFLVQLEADGRSQHTIKNYRRHVRAFATWSAHERPRRALASIDHGTVAAFLAAPEARQTATGEPKAACSMNSMRTSLRVFFRYLREWKADDRGRVTIPIDVYARLMVYVNCGSDLCKVAVVDACAIPPLPDLAKVTELDAAVLRSWRDSEPLLYRAHLESLGLLRGTPEIEKQHAQEGPAELLVPYDGEVYVRAQTFAQQQAATLVNTRRGTSTDVRLSIGSHAVVEGVLLKEDGTPARRHDIYVAIRSSFRRGDFTAQGSSMLVISRESESLDNGETKETIHHRSMTDSDGRFSVPVPFTHEVCVYAFTEGGRVSMVTKTAKSRGHSVRELELRLPAAAGPVRRMRFVQGDGTPVANTNLRADRLEFTGEGPDWSIVHRFRTDADGWADVSGLNAGSEYRFDDGREGIQVVPRDQPTSSLSERSATARVKDGAVVTLLAQ